MVVGRPTQNPQGYYAGKTNPAFPPSELKFGGQAYLNSCGLRNKGGLGVRIEYPREMSDGQVCGEVRKIRVIRVNRVRER